MLEPSNQLIGGGHRLYLPFQPSRLVDSLQLPEVEEGDLCCRDSLKEKVVGMLGVAECPRGAFEPPVVSGDAEREGGLELRGVVFAGGKGSLFVLGQGTSPGLLVFASPRGTSTASAQC